MSEYNINNTQNEQNGETPVRNENLSDNVYETSAKQNENAQEAHRYDPINATPNNTYGTQYSNQYAGQYARPYTNIYGQQYQNGAYQSTDPYYKQGYNTTVGSGASYTFSNDPSYGADPSGNVSKPKQKKKRTGLKIAAIILACVLLAGGTGIGGALLTYSMLKYNDNPSNVQQNEQQNTPGTDNDNLPQVDRAPVSINKVEGSTVQSTTLTEVIAAVRDSVVEIVTENIQESVFYGQYVTSGAGSGVIINENGYIITNNHVVDGANNIYVRTTDEKEYKAALIGKDAESDVAVIKIDATGLSPATLGDSSAIKLGEEVIAIGNPLGSLGGTVTNGIISALDREVTIGDQKMVLLQTNAAVNPGNSGGGLFNMAGELIGVVNAKSSSSSSGATIEGLGFAIPVNHAFEVSSQLIEFGYVKGKVSLGISVYAYEKDMVYKQGFSYYTIKAGVYVDDPGKNTELKKDDRFISIDGKSISASTDIKAILAEHKVGDKLNAVVARTQDNKETQVEVTLTCYEFVPTNN